MSRDVSRNTRASRTRICAAVGVVPSPAHRASLALQLSIHICAGPKRTAHSPLSVSLPSVRHSRLLFPHRPLPLSLRASAPSKCVPIRAGFRPLVSSVFVGAVWLWVPPLMVWSRGGARMGREKGQRWGDEGRRPRQRCAALPNLVPSSVWQFGIALWPSRLRVGLRVCRLRGGERRGPGPQTQCCMLVGIVAHTRAVLEGEGVTAETGAGERTGGREADTHPPRLVPRWCALIRAGPPCSRVAEPGEVSG
jgi:hypothetical protein